MRNKTNFLRKWMKRIESDKKAIFVPIVVLIVLIIASIVLSQICKSSDVYKSLVQVAIFSLVCLVTLIMASTADSPKKKTSLVVDELWQTLNLINKPSWYKPVCWFGFFLSAIGVLLGFILIIIDILG